MESFLQGVHTFSDRGVDPRRSDKDVCKLPLCEKDLLCLGRSRCAAESLLEETPAHQPLGAPGLNREQNQSQIFDDPDGLSSVASSSLEVRMIPARILSLLSASVLFHDCFGFCAVSDCFADFSNLRPTRHFQDARPQQQAPSRS
jgi:hypothetical protein